MTAPAASDFQDDIIETATHVAGAFYGVPISEEVAFFAKYLMAERTRATDHIATLESENAKLREERDDARRLRDEIGRAWDSADARAKAAEVDRDALRAALRRSLVAMKLVAALPGVSDEYYFAPAIEYAARALSGKATS